MDLWLEQLQRDEEYEEDNKENEDDLIAKQDFRCLCFRCYEEITWFHRYYYTCDQCNYSIHKFCGELSQTVEEICYVGHTLYFDPTPMSWRCCICHSLHRRDHLRYNCPQCDFNVDADCITRRLQKNIIYHPSHDHPLVGIPKQLLYECDACEKEHKGLFYYCNICASSFIHRDCASLPEKLKIKPDTHASFSHIHPLSLAYSFPYADQISKFHPQCRVCHKGFHNPNVWIYKCEKCRYYTHLNCATSRNEPFMSILAYRGNTLKNYDDVKHPDLLQLPFRDQSYSIQRHLFSKKNEESPSEISKIQISHQHPLVLDDEITTSLRFKSISYHDPMKRIELLCNGCLRPIMTRPVYVCANEEEHCNFVLHEWCSRLPTELKNYFGHRKHTLVLHSKIPATFFGVFYCYICRLPCNGFVYYCEKCIYCVDVNCAFLPNEITHTSHPNHLLSRVYHRELSYSSSYSCNMCPDSTLFMQFSFSCNTCDFHLHPVCALLIPEKNTHKCDKHPMKLNYFPAENHKSEYFCEICEDELNPEYPFYHCDECMQSMHTACAPVILQYEAYMRTYHKKGIHYFVNVKFGDTYENIKIHPHPLSFVQGIASDGQCNECGSALQYKMIFRCSNCKFAIDYYCCEWFSQ